MLRECGVRFSALWLWLSGGLASLQLARILFLLVWTGGRAYGDGRRGKQGIGTAAKVEDGGGAGVGSSNLHILTFPNIGSLTGGPAYDGPDLSVIQSQTRLSQTIPFWRGWRADDEEG
jgi:hypothetical protein